MWIGVFGVGSGGSGGVGGRGVLFVFVKIVVEGGGGGVDILIGCC